MMGDSSWREGVFVAYLTAVDLVAFCDLSINRESIGVAESLRDQCRFLFLHHAHIYQTRNPSKRTKNIWILNPSILMCIKILETFKTTRMETPLCG